MVSVSCLKRLVVMACGASIVLATELVSAQAVFDEHKMNAEDLKKALTPEDPVLTRGFGFDPAAADATAPGKHRKPNPPGVAAMLISFTSNSSDLTPTAMAALDQVGKAMRSDQLAAYRFQIEGHADPRGPFDANMRLSKERAEAVVRYLSSAGGVAPERLTAVGKGSTEPMYPRNPAAPENRRVTIVTMNKQ